MDDRRFDSVAKAVASAGSRRRVLKAMLGLGGAALTGGILFEPEANAARRPTPTPKPRTCPGVQIPCGNDCCCPSGSSKCGPDCCPDGQAVCCDNACCYGECYGEELCCADGTTYCPGIGCLEEGLCCDDSDCAAYADPATCAPGICGENRVCVTGTGCVGETTCCPEVGCLTPEQCCTEEDCPDFTYCNLETHICTCEGECCFCAVEDGCGGMCECPEGFQCLGNGCFTRCVEGECTEGCEFCQCAAPWSAPTVSYCVSMAFPGDECESDEDCGLGSFCAENPAGGVRICLYPCCFFESGENCWPA